MDPKLCTVPNVQTVLDVPGRRELVASPKTLCDGPKSKNSAFEDVVDTRRPPRLGEDVLPRHDVEMLNRWATSKYKVPSLFRLLVAIAKIQTQCTGAGSASTEQLVACSLLDPNDIRVEVFRILKRAWDLGLLHRKGEPHRNNGSGSVWTLTADGRRFLVHGLRSRLNMQKFSKLTRTQICDALADDEITEWEYDLRERNRLVESTNRATAKINPDVLGRRHAARLPSKITDEPIATKALSREAVANALHENALVQAKFLQSDINPLWSGLVRQ